MKPLALLAALFAFPASAHDWYPASCCSDKDCFPVASSDIRATEAGWLIIPTGQVISYEAARITPEEGGGQFHICTRDGAWPGSVIGEGWNKACFWAPGSGS
jgi:hypothetical protein